LKFKRLLLLNTQKEISLRDILNSSLSDEVKADLIEEYRVLLTYEYGCSDYIALRNQIRKQLKCPIVTELIDLSNIEKIFERIDKSDFNRKVKDILYQEAWLMRTLTVSSEEYYKQTNWLNIALRIPTKVRELPVNINSSKDQLIKFQETMMNKLNEKCYGMKEAKELILDFIFNFISNPNSNKYILALHGPSGVGKTNLANIIAECLGRDIIKISLGGNSDPCKLIGHNRAYIGANVGEIAGGLSKIDHNNPVIYIDELDKIYKTSHNSRESGTGSDGSLIHILDPLQNMEFIDEYLRFPIDLSKALFIVSFNDIEVINPILRARLYVININKYSVSDKIELLKGYLIKEINKNLGIVNNKIVIPDSEILYLISLTEQEEGVRKLQQNLEFLFRRVNRKLMTSSINNEEVHQNKKAKIDSSITITRKLIDEIMPKKNNDIYNQMYI
jgi:ATP-dependent Lon protease